MRISYTEKQWKTWDSINCMSTFSSPKKKKKKKCYLISLFVYPFILFYQARHSYNQYFNIKTLDISIQNSARGRYDLSGT